MVKYEDTTGMRESDCPCPNCPEDENKTGKQCSGKSCGTLVKDGEWTYNRGIPLCARCNAREERIDASVCGNVIQQERDQRVLPWDNL